MRPAILLGTANLLIIRSVQAASCYTVNGEQCTDSSLAPCDPTAEVSPCCASNKGTISDICMSSGLCYAQDSDNRGLIDMNGCTDDTGLSADCPHTCPDGVHSCPPISLCLILTAERCSNHKFWRRLRRRVMECFAVRKGYLLLSRNG